MKTIYLAGGCFWGMQKYFDQFDGILRTEVGYANGPDRAPSYEEVCADSGHAETLKIDYDEQVISLEELLDRYFPVIDPLSVNRQGHRPEGIQPGGSEGRGEAGGGGSAASQLLSGGGIPPEVPGQKSGRILPYPGRADGERHRPLLTKGLRLHRIREKYG